MKEFEEVVREFECAAFREGQSCRELGEIEDVRRELLRRYELAQRARARNLVRVLRWEADYLRAEAVHARNPERVREILAPVCRNESWADRIAAKYLGGKL